MESAARDERDEARGRVASVLGSDEEPIVASPGDAPQFALGPVVVDGHAANVEERPQSLSLVLRVADGLGERRFVEALKGLGVTSLLELLDDGAVVYVADLQSQVGRDALDLALLVEQLADKFERVTCALGL